MGVVTTADIGLATTTNQVDSANAFVRLQDLRLWPESLPPLRYGTPIKYTHDDAYGFPYIGTIVAKDGTRYDIDEIFVRGEGSQAPHGFSCVKDPVTFPGKLKGEQGQKTHEDTEITIT